MSSIVLRRITPVCALALWLALLPAAGGWSAPAAPGDERWAGEFGPPGEGNGLSASPLALLADGQGNLYAAGYFTQAGGTTVGRVARWDGVSWYPMGYVAYPPPLALAMDASGNLYLGGAFSSPPGYIARWTGSDWADVSGGMDNYVRALAADKEDKQYVGGEFGRAGSVDANCIAIWDGANWSALGTGMGGDSPMVKALAVHPITGHLYAGGSFKTAGGVNAANIARWDGHGWSALGSGVNGAVGALAFDGQGNLYAGGNFTEAGGAAANHIARWDGTSWSSLSSGASGAAPEGSHVVNALAFDNARGILYAGGAFTDAGGLSANRVAAWNGMLWSPLGSGLGGVDPPANTNVYALALDRLGNLYVGGYFTTAGGKPSAYIARWNASVRQIYLPLVIR